MDARYPTRGPEREEPTVQPTASDDLARHLLTHTDATEVEITALGLEDAFLALTGDTTATTTSGSTR